MQGCSQGFALEDKRFTDLAHCESVSLLTRYVTRDTRNMELEVRKLRTYGSFPAENLRYSEVDQCLHDRAASTLKLPHMLGPSATSVRRHRQSGGGVLQRHRCYKARRSEFIELCSSCLRVI